jgi:hypothetical protein
MGTALRNRNDIQDDISKRINSEFFLLVISKNIIIMPSTEENIYENWQFCHLLYTNR